MEPRYGISANWILIISLDETSMNPNGEKFRGWYSDAEDYNKIIDIFNKKKSGTAIILIQCNDPEPWWISDRRQEL